MTQFYLDLSRESDPYALPDAEAFYIDQKGYLNKKPFVLPHEPGETAYGLAESGWYWQCYSPGCLPDSDPSGPFESEQAAIADAQDF